MKLDLTRVRESKRAFRRRLAAQPIAQKLPTLDTLHERTLAIQRGSNSATRKKNRRLRTAS